MGAERSDWTLVSKRHEWDSRQHNLASHALLSLAVRTCAPATSACSSRANGTTQSPFRPIAIKGDEKRAPRMSASGSSCQALERPQWARSRCCYKSEGLFWVTVRKGMERQNLLIGN